MTTVGTSIDSNLFLKGEYIKRHFEQESPDVDWLIDNWCKPLEKYKVNISTTYMKSIFVNDIILMFHQKKHNLEYSSIFADDYNDEMKFIISRENEWIEKMYYISCEYGICASELIIPYNIELLLTMPEEKIKELLQIPAFIEHIPSTGFLGCEQNSNNICAFFNITAKDYSISQIITYMQKTLTILRMNEGISLTKDEEVILEDMKKSETEKKGNQNAQKTRLLGLLHWDLRIQQKSLEEIRNIIREKKFYSCPPNTHECQHCESRDSCKTTCAKQLNTAAQSIFIKNVHPVQQGSSKYSYKGKKLKVKRNDDFLEENIEISIG